MKITVEFDEGVKASAQTNFTLEAMLMTLNGKTTRGFEEMLKDQAAGAAAHCVHKILTHFQEHGLLMQRSHEGLREVMKVTDVEEALAWLKAARP